MVSVHTGKEDIVVENGVFIGEHGVVRVHTGEEDIVVESGV